MLFIAVLQQESSVTQRSVSADRATTGAERWSAGHRPFDQRASHHRRQLSVSQRKLRLGLKQCYRGAAAADTCRLLFAVTAIRQSPSMWVHLSVLWSICTSGWHVAIAPVRHGFCGAHAVDGILLARRLRLPLHCEALPRKYADQNLQNFAIGSHERFRLQSAPLECLFAFLIRGLDRQVALAGTQEGRYHIWCAKKKIGHQIGAQKIHERCIASV